VFRVKMKVQVLIFWVFTSYSDEVEYERFGGPCCLHLQGEDEDHVMVFLDYETM
jgi:hypothetical protein